MTIESMGGRKFLLTVAALIVGTLVQVFGKNGVNTEFVSLLVGLSASFGIANVAGDVVASKLPKEQETTPWSTHIESLQQPPAVDHSADIAELKESISKLAEITLSTAKATETATKLAKVGLLK